jgi:hypothetical protein
MKFLKIVPYMLFACVTVAFFSCSKEKPEIENTSTYKMAGEWFTRTYNGGSAVIDYKRISTYNTSDPNASQIWVDDLGHIWPFKAKMDVDYAGTAFKSMASTPNIATGQTGTTIKVIEGKVLPEMGVSKSGNKVDSIYLKLEFSDDPGEVYEIRGHQRTGFFEDELAP